MGLFSSSKPDVEIVDPLAAEKKKAYTSSSEYLTNLLAQPIARQGVAGMSDIESYGQEYLRNYATSPMPQGVSDSYNYYQKILNQPIDITQLPEYQGVLNSVRGETSDATNRAMRRTQMQGMGTSTPQGKAVGREVALGGQRMLAQLGPYAEAERGRQMNAAQMMSQIAQLQEMLQQGRLGAMSQYGALPRQLGQAELDAIYNQAMAPWTIGAPTAQGMMGNSSNIDYALTQDPSIMTQIAPMLGQMGSAIIGSDKAMGAIGNLFGGKKKAA